MVTTAPAGAAAGGGVGGVGGAGWAPGGPSDSTNINRTRKGAAGEIQSQRFRAEVWRLGREWKG